MHELITDQSFDLNRSNDYILSIQVSLDGFSFSVIRIDDNRLIAVNHSPVTISTEKFITRRFDEWVKSEKILNQNFAEVRIQYYTRNFTAIPESFFTNEKQNEIAALLFEQEVTSQVINIHPENTGTRMLFSVPAGFSEKMSEKFGSFEPGHPAAVLAEKCTSLFSEQEKGAMLYFNPKSFVVVLFSGEKLLVANSYKYSHPNDVVYYLMNLLNQNQIKPDELKLILTGEIIQNDEIEVLLRSYFNKTEFWVPNISYDSESFKNLHRFISLL